MQQVLDLSFAGNDVLAWTRAALWILGAVALMKFLLPVVIRRISRWAVGTTTHLDDAVVKALGAVRWWMVALPIACMAVVAAWLWRRPEPPRAA